MTNFSQNPRSQELLNLTENKTCLFFLQMTGINLGNRENNWKLLCWIWCYHGDSCVWNQGDSKFLMCVMKIIPLQQETCLSYFIVFFPLHFYSLYLFKFLFVCLLIIWFLLWDEVLVEIVKVHFYTGMFQCWTMLEKENAKFLG